MFIDGATEIGKAIITPLGLAAVAKASEVPRENPSYGPEAIFGERIWNDPKDTFTPLVGDGLWEAWRSLFGPLIVGGSAISAAELPEGQALLGFNSELLGRLAPLHGSGIWWRYYNGELDPTTLTPEGYLGLLILRGLRGSNLDVQGRDARNDFDDTLKKAIAIARFGFTYPFDGPPRGVSYFNYNGRLPVIHFEQQGDTVSGGINFIVFPYAESPDDPWSRVTNLRKRQTQPMVRDRNGHITLQPAVDQNKGIAMLDGPWTPGSWNHHTARAIRSGVILGMPEAFDAQTFAKRKPKDNKISFEDAVGTAVNLTVAAGHDPYTTHRLVEATGLSANLPYLQNSKCDDVAAMIAKGHDELFGPTPIQAHEWGPKDQLVHLGKVGKLVAPWMPIPASPVLSLVPDPQHRETVRWFPAGQTPMSQDLSIAGDFVKTAKALTQEQMEAGNSEAAEILIKAADAVEKQFIR